jgi:hypothetical protein
LGKASRQTQAHSFLKEHIEDKAKWLEFKTGTALWRNGELKKFSKQTKTAKNLLNRQSEVF